MRNYYIRQIAVVCNSRIVDTAQEEGREDENKTNGSEVESSRKNDAVNTLICVISICLREDYVNKIVDEDIYARLEGICQDSGH